MSSSVFTPDFPTDKELIYTPGEAITAPAAVIEANSSEEAI